MCQISSRSEWNQSSTVEAKILPNTSYSPIARSPTTPSRSMERPPSLPTKRRQERRAIGPAPAPRDLVDDGPRAHLLDRVDDGIRHLRQGVVPGDALPPAGAALAHPLEGGEDPLLGVEHRVRHQAPLG